MTPSEQHALVKELNALIFLERIMVGTLLGTCIGTFIGVVGQNDSEVFLSTGILVATLIAGGYNDVQIRAIKERLNLPQ